MVLWDQIALAFAADEVIELGKKELVVATFVVTLFKKYEVLRLALIAGYHCTRHLSIMAEQLLCVYQ